MTGRVLLRDADDDDRLYVWIPGLLGFAKGDFESDGDDGGISGRL